MNDHALSNANVFSNTPTISDHEQQLRLLASDQNVLQNKIRDAQRTLNSLNKENDNVLHEMRLSAFRTSLSECRLFTTNFLAKLPPELRNLVYTFAWTPQMIKNASEKWHIAVQSTSKVPPWHRPRTDILYKNLHYKRMPLWILPPFVGSQVAKEAAAVYYSKLPADIVSGSHIDLLSDFLDTDHLFLDLFPAEHLRSLDLTISPNQCRALSEDRCAHRISSEGLGIVEEQLEYLHHLKYKNGFRLSINFLRDTRGRQLSRALQILGPTCQELQAEGVNLVVWGYPDGPKTFVARDITTMLEEVGRRPIMLEDEGSD